MTRLLCLFCAAAALFGQAAPDAVAAGKKALDLLLASDLAKLRQMFTPQMAQALSEDSMKGLGAQIQSLGTPRQIGEPQRQSVGGISVVVIPVKFAAAEIAFQFSIDGSGKLAGLFLRPATPPAAAWTHPAYSKPDAFREREVMVGDDPWKLPGILAVPTGKGPFPGIVLVHGSGPNDRDETLLSNKPFKDLAEGLASRGIAVLRYEKRTKQHQARFAALPGITVQEEVIDDALKAAALLRSQPEIDRKRVCLLGHSLGGYLAPRIAQRDTSLAGIVVLAGNARPLEDLIVEQTEYLNPGGAASAKEAAAKIKALTAESGGASILGAPPAYWLDLRGYAPAAIAATLRLPMLILQGERDYQVTMKDFALWRTALAGHKNATLRSFPALNHLFVSGEGKSVPAEYSKPGHVDEEVIDAIASFAR